MNKILKALLPAMILAASLHAAPNIVVILADDMGVGDLSCLNAEAKVDTPRIDALAGQGMIFRDAHTSSAVCTPTRYGLLTGRYNWRSILKSRVIGGYSGALIEPGRDTVASLLKRHGYQTAMIGKWHLGLNWLLDDGTRAECFIGEKAGMEERIDFSQPYTGGPCELGFDTFFGISASLDFPPYVWLQNDRVAEVPSAQRPAQGGKKAGEPQLMMRGGLESPEFYPERVLEGLTAKAVQVIRDSKPGQPLFLYLPLNAPHTPVVPREKFKGSSECGIYGDFIQEIDWSVGEVVSALKEKGMLENTLLIFTADNGASRASFPDELEATYGHQPSGIYRGRKASIWEGGHRVPFIVSWPGKVERGTECAMACNLNDLYATFAAMVGEDVPPNRGEDSFSILPLLQGKPGEYHRNGMVHQDFQGRFAFRDGPWKLIMGSDEGDQALYNLDEDPSEKKNRIREEPEVASRLQGELTKIIQEGRSTPGPMESNDGPAWWEQLYWIPRDGS